MHSQIVSWFRELNCCGNKNIYLKKSTNPFCSKMSNLDFSLTKEEWRERYKKAMLLGGAGDAIGYYRGRWEFKKSGEVIHEELRSMGGLEALKVQKPDWIVSDDTVMHLAIAEAIVEYGKTNENDLEKLYSMVAKHFIICMHDMENRAPGITSMGSVSKLRPDVSKGYVIPFNKRGGGCGAAMRSMCIGMYYPRPEQLESLVAVSIETGRMTHNSPTGYLGSLASALFTHYAIQRKPIQSWGAGLLKTLDLAWSYIEEQGRDVKENREMWNFFENAWTKYVELRGIDDGVSLPRFPDYYGVKERDQFYEELSFDGWGGASGHDAPMIAYDAFLGSGNSWKKLAERAFFHGGDSDSTAIICATWFGLWYGTKGVPPGNYQNLEYKERLEDAGNNIFNMVEHFFDD